MDLDQAYGHDGPAGYWSLAPQLSDPDSTGSPTIQVSSSNFDYSFSGAWQEIDAGEALVYEVGGAGLTLPADRVQCTYYTNSNPGATITVEYHDGTTWQTAPGGSGISINSASPASNVFEATIPFQERKLRFE